MSDKGWTKIKYKKSHGHTIYSLPQKVNKQIKNSSK